MMDRRVFFTVRSLMDQTPWFDQVTLEDFFDHKQNNNISQWRNRFGDFTKFIDNRRFVMVRSDGSRISTDALHRIESWFLKLWLLFRDDVLQEKNIELFIRYLVVFAQANRSDFLHFYFNDSEAKIHKVLGLAIERTKKADLKIRDYKHLDRIYRDIYEIS